MTVRQLWLQPVLGDCSYIYVCGTKENVVCFIVFLQRHTLIHLPCVWHEPHEPTSSVVTH